MRFVATTEPPDRVTRLGGRLTFTDGAAFRALLGEMRESGVDGHVLDMSDLSFLDSAGIGMLVILRGEADRAGWRVRLRGAAGLVRLALERSALHELFEIETA